MVRYTSECVGCPPEMGCLHDACPYENVPVHDCDECGAEEAAKYVIDNMELCSKCSKEWFEDYYNNLDESKKKMCQDYSNEFLDSDFMNLTIPEKAEALDIKIEILPN